MEGDNISMKLMLIGEKYSNNFGDGIIYEVVERLLSNINLNIEFIEFDISLKSSYEFKKIDFNYKQVIRKEIKYILTSVSTKIMRRMSESNQIKRIQLKYPEFKKILDHHINENKVDAILIVGGQLFNVTFISRLNDIIETASKHNIPVSFNACGWGNSLSDRLLQDVDTLLDKDVVKYISVRDGLRLLNKIDSDKYHFTFDTAVLVKTCIKPDCVKTDEIGLGIMISKNQDVIRQIIFWKKFIEKLKSDKIKFSIFTNGDPYDEGFVRCLCRMLDLDDKNVHIPKSPNELISIITSYKSIVSMRLHSLIVAYSYGVPFTAIAWDKKILDFCKINNLKEYCFDFSSNISEIINKCKVADIENFHVNSDLSSRIAKSNMKNIISILKEQESRMYE